jgi:hypothetical protein
MSVLSNSIRRYGKKLPLFFVWAMTPLSAQAHVKWFSTVSDTRASPLTPLEVISSPLFIRVSLLAAAVILAVALVDGLVSQRANYLFRLAASFEQRVNGVISPLLRFGVAIYFAVGVLYFRDSPIILTPELKTTAVWVPVLQLAIAAAALSRRTVMMAGLGIVLLYAYAVSTYGWFHMLDYPVFIGIAVCLAMGADYRMDQRDFMLSILRVTTGFTLLWAGVEKWLYPAWCYDLLEHDLHAILMGFSPEFFVLAAGFVEFCLAFVLMSGRLASQVASAVLLTMMILAVPLAGTIDLIGHLPFILVLAILAATRNAVSHDPKTASSRLDAISHAFSFGVSVLGSIGAYYISHELAYTASRRIDWTMALLASCLVALLMSRIVETAPRSLSTLRSRS